VCDGCVWFMFVFGVCGMLVCGVCECGVCECCVCVY